MNIYVFNELVNSLESAVSELKDFRDELKQSDDSYDIIMSKEISKALTSINLLPLIRLVNNI